LRSSCFGRLACTGAIVSDGKVRHARWATSRVKMSGGAAVAGRFPVRRSRFAPGEPQCQGWGIEAGGHWQRSLASRKLAGV
jgi:hypothetical protein